MVALQLEVPSEIRNLLLTSEMIQTVRATVLEYLGFKKEMDSADVDFVYDDESVIKRIKNQSSPRKECILLPL